MPMIRTIPPRLALSLAGWMGLAAIAASCTSPTVGDMCSGTCALPTRCETVCPCGNAACLTFECIVITDSGAFRLPDGGDISNCSQP